MLISTLKLVGGLVVLTGAAEVLVGGASSLARRAGLSPLVIGLTVVSIGTSLPELVVGIEAALTGTGDIAVGNVVGSNISNIALILGGAALARPLTIKAQVVRLDTPILIVVSLGGVGLMIDGGLSRADGLLLLLGFLAYIGYNLLAAQASPEEVQEAAESSIPSQRRLAVDVSFFVLGLVGLVVGAHLLVDGAVAVAEALGVGPVLIGLTIVALGTSLPELATSVVAAWRGAGDIAVGNAVGSSIFNILGILSITVLVRPLSTETLTLVDIGFMVGMAVIILPLFWTNWTLSRKEGALLVGTYLVYLGVLVIL